MTTILIIFLSVLGLAIVAFLLYGNSLPETWEVKATKTIHSNREFLYDYLYCIKNWEKWTIWSHDVNPAFEFKYEGSESGPGATQCWKAKNQFGKTKICDGDRPNQIRYMFSFGHGHHLMKGVIELRPRGCETQVIWSSKWDSGKNPGRRIMAKMMVPYMQKDFERGLDRLEKIFNEMKVEAGDNCA